MSAADRRGVFAVPRGAAAYLGTTDTFEAEASAWPAITAADAYYLLAAAARCFSTPPLTRADVACAWAGVRPLVGEDGKSASDISRRDELWTGPAGVLSIAGGKLTAYRKMAERVVDHVESALERRHQACRTADEALIGGDAASDIHALPGGPGAEAAHAVLIEGALTLEDYWVRRSARAWFDLDGGLAALAPAAGAMAPLLGWTEARKADEITSCRDIHEKSMTALVEGRGGGLIA
jgi:glycerol-3-phosphate dehydrogenase